MSQKLLAKPARLLLIALVVVPAMTASVNATGPRLAVRSDRGQRMADPARQRARVELYQPQGIERWGLNE